jgi:cyclophilin family peptidyl-prolyl cis-trans isomerase
MNKRAIQGLAAMLIVGLITACGSSESSKNEAALEGNDFLVTIKTEVGEMKAILYDETPQHKANFLKLINEGYYDSLLFHRVMQGFMIQGGDPNSKNSEPGSRLGSGGPGYTVPAEFVPRFFHEKGALSAARSPDRVNPERASSGSQFYIVQGMVIPREQLEGNDQNKIVTAFRQLMQNQPDHELAKEYQELLTNNPGDNAVIQEKVDATLDRLTEATGMTFSTAEERIEKYSTIGGRPDLDENYTVFGQVIAGLEIIDQIAANPVDPANRPLQDIMMYISVEEMSKKEIAEKYGNPYVQ